MGGGASYPVVPLTKDRIIVVTGGNTGIGYEIAKNCAIMGATVILACRSEERAINAMNRMQEEYELGVVKADRDNCKLAVEFMQVDLSSFKSVLDFCEEFKKTGRQLHVLFCNAGLVLESHVNTNDGFERMLQINYLSHFLMIAKLLPVIKRSGPDCRILSTSSSAHQTARPDFWTINLAETKTEYGLMDSNYSRSKAYQIMQTCAMERRLKGSNISVNCFHPGVVGTEFFNHAESCCLKCCYACILCWARSPIKGATCGIDLAVNPNHVGVSGHYWIDCRIASAAPFTQDEQKQEAVWRETLRVLKEYLTDDEISAMEGN